MKDDELCECGHDRAAHHPALNCSLCECSVPVTPELRRSLNVLARQPIWVIDAVRYAMLEAVRNVRQ